MSNLPPNPGAPAHDPSPELAAARGRVLFPAIFLMVVAVLNVFVALLFTLGGVTYTIVLTPDRVENMLAERNAREWDEMRQNGYTARSIVAFAIRFFFSGAGVMGLAALLIFVGAVRMLQLRSYSLAVSGSVLSIIPCISPSSCLMLGVFAGVWALVVLVDPDVRDAFL